MLDIIVLLTIGFLVGWKAAEIVHILSFRRIMRELGISDSQLKKFAEDQGLTVEEPEPQVRETIHIKIEQHQGQIYAFRSDNDEFLGQGTDRDQLVQRIAERFKGVRMIVDEGADLLQKSH